MGLADVQILAGSTRRPAFRRLLVAAGLVLAALSASAASQERPIVTDAFDMTSASGVSYRIFTAMPAGEAPAAGLPAVYLIDGNRMLPIARDLMAADPAMAAVLVGIGYPTEERDEIVARRYFDLTPETPADLIPLAPGASPPKTGNRDAFLSFIDNELRPRIERAFPVDRTRQTLFGHSLGGLLRCMCCLPGRTPSRPMSRRIPRSGGTAARSWRSRPPSSGNGRERRPACGC